MIKRIYEHKEGLVEGFSKKYAVKILVYYEYSDQIEVAIAREKELKKWKRQWKLDLIEKDNPQWLDLYPKILGS